MADRTNTINRITSAVVAVLVLGFAGVWVSENSDEIVEAHESFKSSVHASNLGAKARSALRERYGQRGEPFDPQKRFEDTAQKLREAETPRDRNR